MMKITILISLMIIGMAWSACDSCGSECERACGTRRFRACCFNYLRRKRGDGEQLWTSHAEEDLPKPEVPAIIIRYVPQDAISKFLGSSMVTPDDFQD